jgi:hypothetical protein
MANSVNSPEHYSFGGIEAIEGVEASMSKEAFHGWLKGNVLTYVWRYERKNGLEDLQKARWNLDRLIQSIEAESIKDSVSALGELTRFDHYPKTSHDD